MHGLARPQIAVHALVEAEDYQPNLEIRSSLQKADTLELPP